MANFRIRHSDRLEQVKIYTGKLFRMFVFQNDWKLLPMAAIIAGAVAFVTGKNMFKTMEGTAVGALALTCICLWNGFFNSIQVICRERPIIKREHRAGLHISAYIFAHIIYQAFLCVLQSVITLGVCMAAKMAFPSEGFLTDWFLRDMGITLFLITFTADMLSLLISSFVKNTTAAMTGKYNLFIAKYGGDEFVMIDFRGNKVPPKILVSEVNEALLSRFEKKEYKLSVSVAYAEVQRKDLVPEKAIDMADKKLYEAKEAYYKVNKA